MTKTLCAAAIALAALFPAAAPAKTLHSQHVAIVQSDVPVKRIDWEVTVPAPIDRVDEVIIVSP